MTGKRHRLVSMRKAAGFSQERLAETVGVERSTVMRWERGETTPQPWARPKLARALDISDQALSELLGDTAELDSTTSAPDREFGTRTVDKREARQVDTVLSSYMQEELDPALAQPPDEERAPKVAYFVG